ncbi:MAG: hypothetical protein H6701_14095 [Myxococcales bacterium]|nr:hypothetical protein [Myxococcales bacterium]
MRTLVSLVSLALLTLPGCDDGTAATGASGGACRIGAMPCDPGLACQGGTCRPAEADAATDRPTLEVEFNLAADHVAADGVSVLAIDFTVQAVAADGSRSAYDAEADSGLFLTPVPSEAGRVMPGRPTIIGGLALVEFVPCDRRTAPVCPPSAVIRLAHDDAPSAAIAESPRFLLTDPPAPGGDADAGGSD